MRHSKKFIVAFFIITTSLLAKANGEVNDKKGDPSISGTISDIESKKPVQGVTVFISGKGQDKKEFTTDASGNFKTTQLVPGEVTIVMEKKGYRTFKKEGILIKEGVTLKLNLDIEEDDDAGVFHQLFRMLDGD